ncbi:hypothetical protein D3C86_1518250 [compost metagenome]
MRAKTFLVGIAVLDNYLFDLFGMLQTDTQAYGAAVIVKVDRKGLEADGFGKGIHAGCDVIERIVEIFHQGKIAKAKAGIIWRYEMVAV